VTYDPQHPTLVRPDGYIDDTDAPATAVVGAVLALLFTAAAAVLTTRTVSMRPVRHDARP